jgi:predicted AAA+ superfamily ATPase
MDAFVTALLERDLPQLGVGIPAETLRRFWMMLAHCHAQSWNSSELARSMGVSPNTARRYLDVLCGLFLARALPPWHENLSKRQVKSPKVYIRDSGILHYLLGLSDMAGLRAHPGYGASWEGFALEQTLSIQGERDAYFWGTQRGAELDLLLIRGGKRYGFEFKCADAPSMTRSMHLALEDLRLERLFVVFPGKDRFRLHERVEALPLPEVPSLTLR